MKPRHLIPIILLLTACGDEAPRYRSGYVCTCEQRSAVGQYVADNQRHGMADNSEYYVDHLFAVAVTTTCDHRDSVLTLHHGRHAIGLSNCEAWYDDLIRIRP